MMLYTYCPAVGKTSLRGTGLLGEPDGFKCHSLLQKSQTQRLKWVKNSRTGDKYWGVISRRWNKCSGRSNFNSLESFYTDWENSNRTVCGAFRAELISLNNTQGLWQFNTIISEKNLLLYCSLFPIGLVTTPTIPQHLKRHFQFIVFPSALSSTTLLSVSAGCFIQPTLWFSFLLAAL